MRYSDDLFVVLRLTTDGKAVSALLLPVTPTYSPMLDRLALLVNVHLISADFYLVLRADECNRVSLLSQVRVQERESSDESYTKERHLRKLRPSKPRKEDIVIDMIEKNEESRRKKKKKKRVEKKRDDTIQQRNESERLREATKEVAKLRIENAKVSQELRDLKTAKKQPNEEIIKVDENRERNEKRKMQFSAEELRENCDYLMRLENDLHESNIAEAETHRHNKEVQRIKYYFEDHLSK